MELWKSQGTRKKFEKTHKSKESRELKVEQSYGRDRIRTSWVMLLRVGAEIAGRNRLSPNLELAPSMNILL